MPVVLALQGSLLDDLGVNPWVVLIQIVVFVTTFLILANLLFRKVLKFMQDRETEQTDAAERIRRNREELEKVRAEYEARIRQVEKETYEKLQLVLREAQQDKARIIAEAQQQARAEVEQARATIAKEKADATAALQAEVARLSREAASRILDEPVR